MLFMVHIEVKIPADMPQKQKDELRERENARAMELIKAGKMRRVWRIVGQVANFSVWEADTPGGDARQCRARCRCIPT